MTKIKTFFFPNIWIIVSCLSLLLAYLLLQPRISNIIPFVREYRLSSFISHSKKNNSISAQEFWQLREFYSPGVILLNKPKLLFTSSKITSQETLIDKKITLDEMLPKESDQQILYKNGNEQISTDESAIYVYFIKPTTDMVQANGFFDYKDKDKKLLEGKSWYVSAIIQK